MRPRVASSPAFSLARVALGALALGGCTVGPDWQPPKWAAPGSWFGGEREKSEIPAREVSRPVLAPIEATWWTSFHDPELTSLVERVAAANLDVRAATIRIAESRAQLGIAKSAAFPSANGNASYSREKLSRYGAISLFGGGPAGGSSSNPNTQNNGLNGTSGAIPSTVTGGVNIPAFDLYQYGFDASWELDLWGRVRRSVESANASLKASGEDRRNTLLSSIAEMARDYVQLRGTQAQLAIARDNLRTAQDILKLTKDRQMGGLATQLDVENAATQVQAEAATIPPLEQQEAEAINAISLLLGLQPNALRGELASPKPIPPVPPKVPVGLPGELARRRPDIRQAEAQLHAATADIGVAVADFYPTITLSGSFSIQALQPKYLTNWGAQQWSLGPSLTLPIFQGGRLRAQLELRKAQQQEAAVTYIRTLLNAWHEVDNDLTSYDAEQRRRHELALEVESNRRALALARDRYTQGLVDFLQVLIDERNLFNAQQELAISTTNVSTNLVALYKALGGGWESDYPDVTGRMKEASAS